MRCPHDHAELTQAIYESDTKVDRCPECGGMWLDKGELETIQEVISHDHSQELVRIPDLAGAAFRQALQQKQPRITCPRCHIPMDRREYGYNSQVLIDVCHRCHGVWLDDGEIRALEVFFERSHMETRELRRAFWQSLKLLMR